jgi:hypothetical protein
LGGGRVANAAGGTGVASPDAGARVAAAVGAHAESGTIPNSKRPPMAVRHVRRLRLRVASVGIELP